jgi:transposase
MADPLRQTLARSPRRSRARLTVERLPQYAHELDDVEAVWRDLKAHHLTHQTCTDDDALDQAIHTTV